MPAISNIQIAELIAPALKILGFEFVGCEFTSKQRQGMLRVYIDHENGVTIHDCELATRQIIAILQVEDPILANYDLEVSSPGLDRPLFNKKDYQRFLGKEIRLQLRIPQDGRRKFRGLLQGVESESIHLLVDGKVYTVLLAHVAKANLVPQF